MNIHPGASWTDERIQELKDWLAEGLSASQIGAEMGVTRNAIIGKVHRLCIPFARGRDMPGRPKISKPQINGPVKRPRGGNNNPSGINGSTRLRKPTEPRPDLGIEIDTINDLPADVSPFACSIAELTDESCRWPLGDPQTFDFRYCGAQRGRGAYCSRHARLAHKPAWRRG